MNLIAFGKNTVKKLVTSEYFDFKKIFILDEKVSEYSFIIKAIKERGIELSILEKDIFCRHIPDKKHQGIIAFMKGYRYSSINYLVRKESNGKFPLVVMLDSIEDPHNFGAIIRTCSAMNVDGIVIANKNQVPVNSTVIKVSTGGIADVPICQVSSLEEAINTLKVNGYKIVSTVCDEPIMTNYNELESNSPLCIVFGNEHDGIKKRIIKKSDYLITIPLENNMNSLNVSVTCGIIIASIKR